MSKNILIMIIAAVVVAAGAGTAVVLMSGGGNDSGGDDGYNIKLEVSQGDATYKEYSVTGSTVTEILQNALGESIKLKSNGNVQSYNSQENTDTHSWIVFRWQSLKGWVPAKDSDLRDDTTLVLEFAEKIVGEKSVEYKQPAFSISSAVYFFIQIPSMAEIDAVANSGDSTPDDKSEGTKLTAAQRYQIMLGWLEKAGIDQATIQEGIWIKGSGTNVNEALADALHTCLFPTAATSAGESKGVMEYYIDGEVVHSHLTKQDQYGWFVNFLGWSDTKLKNGDWTYWSQFAYNPNASSLDDTRQWTFNTLSLGMHDMSKYHYFALVLQTTTEKQADEGVEIDIPTPNTIPGALK